MPSHARGRQLGKPAQSGRTETATRTADPRADVVALQRAAGNRAVTRLLMREPNTAPAREATPQVTSVERVPESDHQVIVWMSDGTRYRVTRAPTGRRILHDPDAPQIRLHSDDERVWMRIAWCRGQQRGEIDVGANPQEALSDLMQTIGSTILSGGGANQVIGAIRETELEPFARLDIAQSRQWRITARVGVSVNSAGLQGVTGNAELDVGWMRVGVQGSVDNPRENPRGQVMLTFTFPLGPREAPRQTCEPQVVEVLWGYQCQRERLRTMQIRGPDIPRHADDTRFVYFQYATADVEGSRSSGELDELRRRLSEGYRVMSVEGYTSPEGPRGAAPRFMGNVALSEARAQAALALATERCPEGRTCTDPAAVVTGRSERPPLTRTVRRRGRDEEVELEGRELEAAVVAQFTADEAEMSRLPQEEQDRIRNERNPRRAAQLIYPWLRRVEIRLRKDWIEPGRMVPIEMWMPEGSRGSCPDDVRAAAIRHWFPPAPPRR
jgi:outer membrane protein OmpA-like peptidoglycan-associated protein